MNDLTDLIFGDDAAGRLGVPDARMHTATARGRRRDSRFTITCYSIR